MFADSGWISFDYYSCPVNSSYTGGGAVSWGVSVDAPNNVAVMACVIVGGSGCGLVAADRSGSGVTFDWLEYGNGYDFILEAGLSSTYTGGHGLDSDQIFC